MNRVKKLLFCISLVPMVLGLYLDDSLAGWKSDQEFNPAALDSLCSEYADAGAFFLYHVKRVVADFDPGSDTITGDIFWDYEVWVLKSSCLEEHSRIVVSDGPRTSLESVDVEILTSSGKKVRGYDKGDLVWRSQMDRGGGVLNLDRKISSAAIPGLSTGQRIRVRIHYKFSEYHGMPNISMGGMEIPCARNLILVQVPDDLEFTWEAVGPDELKDQVEQREEKKGGNRRYSWEIIDVPVISRINKVNIDSIRLNLVTHVTLPGQESGKGSFCAGNSWQDVALTYREMIDDRMAVSPQLEELAAQLTADCKDDSEKIGTLYAHVQNTTRYLGIYEGLEGIIPETAESVRVNKYGDCKGLGVYLIALLRAVNIEAWPVLVRTNHLGSLAEEIPNPGQFNHFIVWADDGLDGIWLDATLEKCPAGAIYPQDSRSPVLTMRPGHEGLAEIPYAAWHPGELNLNLVGQIGPDNYLTLQTELEASGITGIKFRAWQFGLTEKEGCKLRKSVMLPKSLPMNETAGTFDSGDNWASPVNWTLDLVGTRPLPGTRTNLFLPFTLVNIPTPDKNNDPMKRPDRVENWAIAIPSGWEVKPDSLQVRKGGLNWNRFVWQEGDTLRLRREIRWDRETIGDVTEEDRLGAEKEAFAAEKAFITLNKRVDSE